MNNTYMKDRPLLPLIISMTVPMMLSMLVNSLYNIVDSYFVARISEDAMTALSLVFPLQNMVSAIAIGFGVGINATVAYYLGAKKKETADQAASYGLALSALHGLVLTVLCLGWMPSFLRLFTTSASLISLSLRYANIVFLFSIINHVTLGMEKLYQAVGRMNATVVALAAGAVLNMILDPLMIFGAGFIPAMGIEGAAIATGIGQTFTMLIYIVLYLTKKHTLHVSLAFVRPSRKLSGRLYGVGIPASLNMALPSVLITALNGILAVFSPVYILILGIYYKLQTFLYLPASGLIQGMRPLLAYNYGAKEYDRVRKIFHIVLMMVVMEMALGTIVFFFFPSNLMHLFTKNVETIALGSTALKLISLGFMISAVSVTVSGALEGLSKGISSLIISLCRYVIVMIPLAWVNSHFFGASGVWHAFWMCEVISAVISYLIYRKALSF